MSENELWMRHHIARLDLASSERSCQRQAISSSEGESFQCVLIGQLGKLQRDLVERTGLLACCPRNCQ
jgi:hypothetical protein